MNDKQLMAKYQDVEACGGLFDLGKNVLIGRFCNLRSGYHVGMIKIGDHTKISQLVSIIANDHNYKDKDCLIEHQGFTEKSVIIGVDCWIGCNSVVLPGVTVGDGAVIGAGAVVTKNVPAYEVWAGIPAGKIGERK